MLRGQLAPLLLRCADMCMASSAPYARASLAAICKTELHSSGQVRSYAQPATSTDNTLEPSFATSGMSIAPTAWKARTRRTGLIAVKVGMTQEWDEWGVRVPLTVLWVDNCQVVQSKADDKEGYTALQLGIGSKRPKQVNGTQIGHFNAAGVPIKRKLQEFRISEEAVLPVGTEVNAAHFVAGQYVDVSGTTIGKGFQGVMKRWGFAGGSASHGNSKAHRLAGSTGGCQDPGKVFKGKKMAGRMGGKRRTVLSAWLYKVDPQRNLLYVKGQVPGHKGNFVFVRDAVYKKADQQPDRPLPTFIGELQQPTIATRRTADPYEYAD